MIETVVRTPDRTQKRTKVQANILKFDPKIDGFYNLFSL